MGIQVIIALASCPPTPSEKTCTSMYIELSANSMRLAGKAAAHAGGPYIGVLPADGSFMFPPLDRVNFQGLNSRYEYDTNLIIWFYNLSHHKHAEYS